MTWHRTRGSSLIPCWLFAATFLSIPAMAAPGQSVTTATSEEPSSDEQPATAQKGDDGTGSQSNGGGWRERIVVTATRTNETAGTLPLAAKVIEREELEAEPSTGTLDLTRQITSLASSRDDSNLVAAPRSQGFSFRGVGGNSRSRALLLLDGVPLGDTYGGWTTLEEVPKELIDRVEVVRGGGAGVWGNLALSGVINLITRAPSDRQFGVTMDLGELDTQDLTASYTDAGTKWSGWLAGNYFDTNGYHLLLPEVRGAIDEPAKKQYETFRGRLDYTVSPSLSLNLGGSAHELSLHDGTPLARNRYRAKSLTARVDGVAGGASWQLGAFGRDRWARETNPNEADDRNTELPNSYISGIPATELGLDALYSRTLGEAHTFSSGIDLLAISMERNEVFNWSETRYTTGSFTEGKQTFAGLFARDAMRVTSRLNLILSARLDSIRTYDGHYLYTDLATGNAVDEQRLDAVRRNTFNPTVGFTFEANRTVHLRGAAYTGFRSATASELFVGFNTSSGITAPNPGMSPEKLRGGEIGADFTPAANFSAHTTVFSYDVSDLIQRVTIGRAGSAGEVIEPCGFVSARRSCRQFRNVAESRSRGLELSAEYRPVSAWRLSLDLTGLDAEVRDDPTAPQLAGNRLSHVPEFEGSLSVVYATPKLWRFRARGRYIGERFDDTENLDVIPATFLVDLSASRSVGARLELFAGVENALDRDYVSAFTGGDVRVGSPRLAHLGLRLRVR